MPKTPHATLSVRLRKRMLSENERKRFDRSARDKAEAMA
jgi:hypothetical protein